MNREEMQKMLEEVSLSLELGRNEDAISSLVAVSEPLRFKMDKALILSFNDALKDFSYAYEQGQDEIMNGIYKERLFKILTKAINEDLQNYKLFEHDVYGKEGYITLCELHEKKKEKGEHLGFFLEKPEGMAEIIFNEKAQKALDAYLADFKKEDRVALYILGEDLFAWVKKQMAEKKRDDFSAYPDILFAEDETRIFAEVKKDILAQSEGKEDALSLYKAYRSYSQGRNLFETDRLQKIYHSANRFEKDRLYMPNTTLLQLAEYMDGLENPKVLELGCGAGHNLAFLKKRLKNAFHYTGMDSSRDMIGLAKEHFPEEDFLLQDICLLSKAAFDAYDVIYVAEILNYLSAEEQMQMLKQILASKAQIFGSFYLNPMADSYRFSVNSYEAKAYGAHVFCPNVYLGENLLFDLFDAYGEKTTFVYQKGQTPITYAKENREAVFLIPEALFKEETETQRFELAKIDFEPKAWEAYKEAKGLDYDAMYAPREILKLYVETLEGFYEEKR